MAKKEKKVVEEGESQAEEGGNSTAKDGEKKEQYFECQCGRRYGSLAAVHTHINNKHANEKKQYKSKIKNPKKNGQGPSTSIRMKDINFNQQQADLMCLADTAVKNIYDYIKKHDEQTKQHTHNHILLDENVMDSCDELDDDDQDIDINPRLTGRRSNQIHHKIQAIKDQHNIGFVDQIVKDAKQFQVFKIDKFNLTMIRELTKFFSTSFASMIQLQLEIIEAKNKTGDKKVIDKLNEAEKQIWGDKVKMCEILDHYYNDWIKLRGKEYKTNSSYR